MSTFNLNDFNEQLTGLSEDMLRSIFELIRANLRLRSNSKQAEAATQFRLGDLVAFSSKKGRIYGHVEKINQKSMSVLQCDSTGEALLSKTRWTVSPTLCTKV